MPEVEQIKEFVIAGHGNLEQVKLMLEKDSSLLLEKFEWRENDFESALEGASHVGNRQIALFLLERGAPKQITTAAMLGEVSTVKTMLEQQPERIQFKGAHGIALLPHAALSGNLELVKFLFERGATEGASMALTLVASRGFADVAAWLVEHAKPDLSLKNFQSKTALEIATENNDIAMIAAIKGS